jgi:hypothetical protein
MEPSARPQFNAAGAGFLLAGVTVACGGVGALAGWAAGSTGVGAVGGVVVGIPAGVAVVYRRYRGYFQ